MDAVTIALLAAVLLLETVSHLSLKAAAERVRAIGPMSHTRAMLRQPLFWAGVVAFAGLFLAWLAFIARVPLAKGIMLGAVTIVGVMIGGRLCFNERLTPPRAIAVSLIALGVALVGWGG